MYWPVPSLQTVLCEASRHVACTRSLLKKIVRTSLLTSVISFPCKQSMLFRLWLWYVQRCTKFYQILLIWHHAMPLCVADLDKVKWLYRFYYRSFLVTNSNTRGWKTGSFCRYLSTLSFFCLWDVMFWFCFGSVLELNCFLSFVLRHFCHPVLTEETKKPTNQIQRISYVKTVVKTTLIPVIIIIVIIIISLYSLDKSTHYIEDITRRREDMNFIFEW